MNLLNFNEIYSDEESCKLKFKEGREKQGGVTAIPLLVYRHAPVDIDQEKFFSQGNHN